MGKKKIIFNLSIDDLKELGIIKRRRRKKRLNKTIQYIPQNNIKSVSDHMQGYSNEFRNTSNLQTENLRLQNDVLSKYPTIQAAAQSNNNNSNNFESRFKTIEDDSNKHKRLTQYILQSAYGGEFNNRPMTTISSMRDAQVEEIIDDPNNILHEEDNVDVATTGGSDSFNNFDNDKDGSMSPDTTQIEINETPSKIPNTAQIGIRSPNILNESNTSYDAEIEFIRDPEVEEKQEEKVEEKQVEEKVEEKVEETEAYALAKAQMKADKEIKEARKLSAEKQAQKLAVLRKEYSELGGKDTVILSNKTQAPIKVEIDKLKQKLQELKKEYTDLGGNNVSILQNKNYEFIQQAINELKVAREEAILQIQQQNVKKKEKKSKK